MTDITTSNFPDEEEWNSFMSRVDQVGKVIKGLASEDCNVSEIAIKKADEILGPKKDLELIEVDESKSYVKNDRTLINRSATEKQEEPNTMSQEAFMRSVELDAKKRAEDRRLAKEVADRHMKYGNQAFRQEDYDKALCCFNKAIDSVRDSCLLYTNRALTCLKLGLNQRALDDSKTALFLKPNSLKGHLYKAQALHCLGDYIESQNTIEEACKLYPEKTDFIEGIQKQWIEGRKP